MKSTNFDISDSLDELKDTKRSSSNFVARDWKVSKIDSPIELKLKKIKLKKHSANKISSLNTTNSKKHITENKKSDTMKKMSNIGYKVVHDFNWHPCSRKPYN